MDFGIVYFCLVFYSNFNFFLVISWCSVHQTGFPDKLTNNYQISTQMTHTVSESAM